MAALDLEGPGERPEDELAALGASVDAHDGRLHPVTPRFSMTDPLLCPPRGGATSPRHPGTP